MTDVGRLLRDSDPVAREDDLSLADAQSMRRAVVTAAAKPPAVPAWWPQPMFVSTAIAATLVAGVAIGRWLPARPAVSRGATSDPPGLTDSRRQLQFASPGGTRIIWVFDPEFNP